MHVLRVSKELRFFPGRFNAGSPYLLVEGRETTPASSIINPAAGAALSDLSP